MIINYFDFFCESIRPAKANSPLIIDANAVLTGTIAFKRLKMIAGRDPQILKAISDFELSEFPAGNFGNINKFLDTLSLRERSSVLTFKWSDHVSYYNAVRA